MAVGISKLVDTCPEISGHFGSNPDSYLVGLKLKL
jgi:hypothetical protein